MTRLLRRALCALAACLTLHAGAASPTLPDFSDLWSVPSESGWGAHLTLQDDILFLVLYVHDAGSAPRFFVATDMRASAQSTPEQPVFAGTLYRTRGAPFRAPYDASRFEPTPVGNATLRFTSAGSATLSYDVQGVSVSKTITRQTLRLGALSGEYLGGTFVSSSGCTTGMGTSLAYPGTLIVSQAGDAVVIDTVFAPGFTERGACRLRGKLVQQGSIASITQGTYACEFSDDVPAVSGTFEITGIEPAENGFSGRYRGTEGACQHVGRIGGIKRGHNGALPIPPEE